MKPLTHTFAAALVLAAALHPAWMQEASAATPAAPVVSTSQASPSFAQILTAPFGSDMAELSTPIKYGLLLIGLSLIEKLSRKERR